MILSIGTETHALSVPYKDEVWSAGGLMFNVEQMVVIAATALLCAVLYVVFKYSKVISWTIETSPDAELVNTMLDAAIETVVDTNDRPVVHSDRGAHYRWPGWLSRIEGREPDPLDVAQGVLA